MDRAPLDHARREPIYLSAMIADSPWPLVLFSPLLAYFIGRLLYYLVCKRMGRNLPFDAEVHARGESLLLGHSIRQVYVWTLTPLVGALARARVRPNTLTVLCFGISTAAGIAIAMQAVTLGGVLGLLGSSLDYFDGRVARLTGQTSRSGGFLDSTLDRYAEVAFLAGASVLFRGAPVLLCACLVALGASGIVSYTRAKAESLGIELKSGMMQRPERVVLFCTGACFSGVLDGLLPAALQGQHFIFGSALCVLAVLTAHTSIDRTVRGFAALRRLERDREQPAHRPMVGRQHASRSR
jgi:CDP-diacylglycerol--glycerol-3-phosphate 3-phosphatidyltransferase